MESLNLHSAVDFSLDREHCLVWIEFQHDRFRLNCAEQAIMQFWARYWYGREFPLTTAQEKREFEERFARFLALNKQHIEECVAQIHGARAREMQDLVKAAQGQLERGRRRGAI